MKRLAICCDGTWNTRDQRYPTNVFKISEAIVRGKLDDGSEQCVYYDDGVGTRSWVDKLPGGVFGTGLWKNVQQAYESIVDSYEAGDEVFLFGFSRGAYTVRSVAGLIRKCGILRREHRSRIGEAYAFYRDSKVKPRDEEAEKFRRDYSVLNPGLPADAAPDPPPVKFLGVWDTVGSLGIPLGILGSVLNRRYRFHDVALSRFVENAYHAVSIDEKRKPFRPTLWEQHPDATWQRMEQRWFAGVHTNVGGGNADARQSDRALLWMMSKARRAGLIFDEAHVADSVQDSLDGTLADSLFHQVARRVPFNLLTYTRPIGAGVPYSEAVYLGGLSNEVVDPAVVDRNLRNPAYMPPNLVAYFRRDAEALTAAKKASRSVWSASDAECAAAAAPLPGPRASSRADGRRTRACCSSRRWSVATWPCAGRARPG